MNVVVILVVLLLIGGGIWLAWRGYQQAKARRAALAAWAGSNGMTYSDRDDSWLQQWSAEPFTSQGFDHHAKEVVSGTWQGHRAASFLYVYKTRSTDSKGNQTTETHTYGVTALALPTALPLLSVSLENVLTRFAQHVGLSDIDLESEDFNRRYRLKAGDRKFATDVMAPRTMQLLLSGPACAFELCGSWAVAQHQGGQDLTARLARWTMLKGVIDGIPDFVWKDHGRP